MNRQLTKKDILKQLKKVTDPELGFDVVDLGYINDVSIKEDKVKVKVVLTTPLCPYAGVIFSGIEKKIKEVPGVKKVELEYDWNHPWSPEKMKPEIRKKLLGK